MVKTHKYSAALRCLVEILCIGLLATGCSTSDTKKEEAQVYLRVGTSQLIKGNYQLALSSLASAEQLDPNDAIIQNNFGLALFVKKDFGRAEIHLRKAISINPKYSDAKNNLGRVHIELARYDEAVTELTEVVKDLTYTSVEKAYVNLGLAYIKKGEYNTALVQLKKAIDANNKFCPAYNYYGQALFGLQKFDQAAESFETALKLCNNNYDEAHYNSGLSYYKIGQKEKAKARLEEVVKLYPGSEYAAKAKAMLKIIR